MEWGSWRRARFQKRPEAKLSKIGVELELPPREPQYKVP